jgi:phosphoribosyl-ATP pyrophosphohydrolase
MSDFLQQLEARIASRREADPEASYVAKLNHKGLDAILKKIGEEATETVIAAKGSNAEAVVYESADLLFHLMVMLQAKNLSIRDVIAELKRREGVSGIDEKNARSK